MAGGGLLQLVSVGAQDVYLIGNPQITFFKVSYQRHTNFSRECIEQTINGMTNFGNRISVNISRSGDLVGPMHVEFVLPALNSFASVSLPSVYNSINANGSSDPTGDNWNWCWVNYVGYRLLDEVTIEIGAQPIDRHYSTWYYMWFELSTPASKREGLQKMVGGYDVTELPLGLFNNAVTQKTLYVPLVFWFNNHPGLALPLIALQYHEVRLVVRVAKLDDVVVALQSTDVTTVQAVLDIEWNTPANVTGAGPFERGTTNVPVLGISVWADYYYLDSEERKRFAQLSHEYLIKQVQQITSTHSSIQGGQSGLIDYKTLNHPVSFNVWGFRKSIAGSQPDWTNFTNSPPFLQFLGLSIMNTHRLVLNGNDRYNVKTADYYNLVQPYHHFTAIPPIGILVYSYALQPVEHQPSGSLNFSRIDNASNKFTLISDLTADNGVLSDASLAFDAWNPPNPSYDGFVYAVNYNVLRIMSGMGGCAYSN